MNLKCIKKYNIKKQIWKSMRIEKELVEEHCLRRDWENAEKWLHKSKSSFKAYRKITQLGKYE